MRRCLLPLVVVCLFFAPSAFSQRVAENESSFAIVGNEGAVRLVFESPTAQRRTVILELLDAGDAVKAIASRANLVISPGKQCYAP